MFTKHMDLSQTSESTKYLDTPFMEEQGPRVQFAYSRHGSTCMGVFHTGKDCLVISVVKGSLNSTAGAQTGRELLAFHTNIDSNPSTGYHEHRIYV
jgi:hypothetical protein